MSTDDLRRAVHAEADAHRLRAQLEEAAESLPGERITRPVPGGLPTVLLLSAKGVIERVVIREVEHHTGRILMVCRLEELEAARAEGREPRTIGFRATQVVKP